MKKLCVSFALLTGLIMAVQPVFACNCPRLSTAKRISYSDVIFVGEVVKSATGKSVTLATKEVLKGNMPKRITVKLGVHDCSYFDDVQPDTGEKYLLFGVYDKHDLILGKCQLPGAISQKEEELQQLRLLLQSDPQPPRVIGSGEFPKLEKAVEDN